MAKGLVLCLSLDMSSITRLSEHLRMSLHLRELIRYLLKYLLVLKVCGIRTGSVHKNDSLAIVLKLYSADLLGPRKEALSDNISIRT